MAIFPGTRVTLGEPFSQGDLIHSCTQGFGLGPKFPLSQSLHANHSGGELPLGVWIGVALTFGWQLGPAKIGHPPLHRHACHIHSRVSCKGTRWGKIIFYRIFIAICAQASATASATARWRRCASLRRKYTKSIT
jgi:hypothetical protein